MSLTLFYKPERRTENKLTHWFLACLERLNRQAPEICRRFFDELGINLEGDGKPAQKMETQVKLGKSDRIDGIIVGKNLVVGFENKVKDKQKGKQIQSYYRLLKKKYKRDCILLLTADRNVQAAADIRTYVREKKIPEDIVRIILWQDIHRILRELSDEYASNFLASFLLRELMETLEKMNMRSYGGISENDVTNYLNIKQELFALDGFLKELIGRKFKKLREKSGKKGSLTKKKLIFPFGKSEDATHLYFKIGDEGFRVGLRCPKYSDDLVKIQKGLDFKSLIELLKSLEGYRVYGLTSVKDEGLLLDDIVEMETKSPEGLKLHRRLQISKDLAFKLMRDPEFKELIREEVESLANLVDLLDTMLV